MWTTVLLLAVAVNFEPTRIGLVPFLLGRDRPLLQLVAFLAGSVTMTTLFGCLILFVFHRVPFANSPSSGGRAQIVVGSVLLLIGTVMAIRWQQSRRRTDAPAASPSTQAGRVEKFLELVLGFLRRGRSPWFAAAVGVGTGLPSVDYLAMLLVIATSRTSPLEQAAALMTFVLIGNIVVMTPLIGYAVAPSATLERINRFAAFTRSRSQIEYASLLFLIGLLLVGLGWSHL